MGSPTAVASPASGAMASIETIPSLVSPSLSSPALSVERQSPVVTTVPQHAELAHALRNVGSSSSLAARGTDTPPGPSRTSSGYRSEDGKKLLGGSRMPPTSASEDDEMRKSDSGASSSQMGPSRRARLAAAAAAAAGSVPPQLAGSAALGSRPPLVSLSSTSSSAPRSSSSVPRSQLAATAHTMSASSSRSNLNYQSKTSMYRQQASAASGSSHMLAGSGSGEQTTGHSVQGSEDGYPSPSASAHGGADLSRAKSVSSVSSVNSTSSMEAVPFRAAPLGNTRLGFGGYGRGAGRYRDGRRGVDDYLGQGEQSTPQQSYNPSSLPSTSNSAQPRTANASLLTAGTLATSDAKSATVSPGKLRVLPKGPSDDWLYRNAPGMTPPNQRSRNQAHTVGIAQEKARTGLRNVFDLDVPDGEEDDAPSQSASIGAESPAKSPMTSIRSKLAKRAGKLGLKPLTNVPSSSVSPPKSSPVPHAGLFVQTEDLRGAQQMGGSPSIVVGSVDTETARLPLNGPMWGPQGGANLASSSSSSSTIAAALLGRSTSPFDVDGQKRTSSITNAPLVVQKNPPGPPGTAPPPSPGLTGMAAYPFMIPAMSIASNSPHGDGSPTRRDPTSVASYLGSGTIAAARRLSSTTRAATLSPSTNRSSGSTLGSSAPIEIGTPPLTPAQQIQLDARAGVATVPAEPSGASPGPSAENSPGLSDVPALADGDSIRRPASTSIIPGKTAKAVINRFSGSSTSSRVMSSKGIDLSAAKRPSFLRTISRQSEQSIKSADSARASPPTSDATKSTTAEDVATPPAAATQHAADAAPTEEKQVANHSEAEADTTALAPPYHGGNVTPGDVTSETTPSHLPSLAVSNSSSSEASLVEAPMDHRATSTFASNLQSSLERAQSPAAATNKSVDTARAGEPSQAQSVLADTPPSVATATATPTVSAKPASSVKGSTLNRTGRTAKDFYFGELLGEGSYSTVIEAWDLVPLREAGLLNETERRSGGRNDALAAFAGKTSGRRAAAGRPKALDQTKAYAIKVLDKMHILKEKKGKYVGIEKEALSIMGRHPGVITLYWTFQDANSLYFVMELAPKGELLTYIKRLGSFDDNCARFYAAQLLDTIESLHRAGILHRDVKPENVLLDKDMRIRLADFGSAKILTAAQRQEAAAAGAAGSGESGNRPGLQRASSFVGTAEYVSPELLTDKRVSEASDIWAFGCIVFQMLAGRPPFKGASEYQTFQKIMRRDLFFPAGLSPEALDLLESTLSLDPEKRLSPAQIRTHAFFKDFDWSTTWTAPVPELAAGLFKRPQEQASRISAQDPDSRDDVDGSLGADTDNEGDVEADDGKSMHSSVDERSSSGGAPFARGLAMTPFAQRATETQGDDGSSLSDADLRPAMRQRGFSTGASNSDRMMRQSDSPRKGASNIFSRVAANFAVGASEMTRAPSRDNVNEGSSRPRHHREASYQQPVPDTQQLPPMALSWAALLLPQESIIYACPVIHKTTGALLRTANKRRQLLLTDFPRLLCVKETNDQLKVKSEIILSNAATLDDEVDANPRAAPASLHDSSESESMQSPAQARQAAMQRQLSANSFLKDGGTPEQAESAQTQRNNRTSGLRRGSVGARVRPNFSSTAIANKFAPTSSITSSVSSNLVSGSTSSQQPLTMPNFMTNVELKTARTFTVHTPARAYVYEDPGGDASHWVKSITMAARRFGAAAASGTNPIAAAVATAASMSSSAGHATRAQHHEATL